MTVPGLECHCAAASAPHAPLAYAREVISSRLIDYVWTGARMWRRWQSAEGGLSRPGIPVGGKVGRVCRPCAARMQGFHHLCHEIGVGPGKGAVGQQEIVLEADPDVAAEQRG